jgi:error-prone DNA polymerase
MTLELAEEIQDFPRHSATHVGGFVITRGPLVELAVVGRAAMEGRTVLEWDKDDIDALGILKVDVLGLGMLSCIRRAFDLLRAHLRPGSHAFQPAAATARKPSPCCAGPTAWACSRWKAARR